MFAPLHNRRIRTMLRLITALFLVIMVGANLLYAFIARSQARSSGATKFHLNSAAMREQADVAMHGIELQLEEQASGYNFQRFFSSNTTAWRYANLASANQGLQTIIAADPVIEGALLVGEDRLRIIEGHNAASYDVYYRIDREYQLFSLIPHKLSIPLERGYRSEDDYVFGIVQPIFRVPSANDEAWPTAPVGNVLALCSMERYMARLRRMSSGIHMQTYAMAGDRMAYGTDGLNAADVASLLSTAHGDTSALRGRTYFIDAFELEGPSATIVNIAAVDELLAETDAAIRATVAISVAISAVFLLCVWALSRSVVAPVAFIIAELRRVGHADHTARVESRYTNEIGILSGEINHMLGKLDAATRRAFDAQHRLHDTELRRKEMELRFYQAQINPHFIFNTLACIRGIASERHVDEIKTITRAIADILRQSLTKQNFISIAEELSCLSSYVEIIEIRYRNQIDFKVDCEEALLHCVILKMLLQPLVENSIVHGILGNARKGRISVTISEPTPGFIALRITDNGMGIAPARLRSLRAAVREASKLGAVDPPAAVDADDDGHGSGVIHVCRKIYLHYGAEASFDVRSREGHYTQIAIVLPKRTRDGGNDGGNDEGVGGAPEL